MFVRLRLTLYTMLVVIVMEGTAPGQAAPDAGAPKLLAVNVPQREAPVDFEREVLPILKRNCLACHSSARTEARLSLETPAAILKGGEGGPAAIAKKGADSLLLLRARGGGDGIMPPADNKANARVLTPAELGLVQLWIDQGAAGSVSSAAREIHWQPLPASINPIYAVAVSNDGQFAVVTRANQVFVYQVSTGREVGRLTDPALVESGVYRRPGVADLDLVQSLALSPDGLTLATGGFQAVKIWQRPRNVSPVKQALKSSPRVAQLSPDRQRLAVGSEDGAIEMLDFASNQFQTSLLGHQGAVIGVTWSRDGKRLLSLGDDGSLRLWDPLSGSAVAKSDLPAGQRSLAFIDESQMVVTGGADGKLRLWKLPVAQAAVSSPDAANDGKVAPALESDKTFDLGGQPLVAIQTAIAKPNLLFIGSESGQITVVDLASGRAAKTLTFGTPVSALAVNEAGSRVAAIGGKSAKLWNVDDGKQLFELKGDSASFKEVAERERAVMLLKSFVATEKNLVADAEKAAGAEKDAIKKAKDAHAAADKTHGEKTAAAKKAAEERAATEQQLARASQAKKDAEAAVNQAEMTLKTIETQLEAAKKAVAEAKANAAKEKDNSTFAESVKQADTRRAELETQLKKARDDKLLAVKSAADAANKEKSAPDELKKKSDAFEAAEKARVATETALKSTMRTLNLAEEAHQRAQAKVEAAKAAVTRSEAHAKSTESELGKARAAAVAAEHPLRAVSISTDGLELATVDDQGLVHTWSAETGAPLDTLRSGSAAGVVARYVDPTRLLTITADKQIVVWDTLPAWRWVRTITGSADRVTALDISSDGRWLAAGGGAPAKSGELKLYELADGKLVREFSEPHSDTVLSVRFSADAKQLATGAADKFVKVFDVANGKFVRSYEGHTHHVLSVSWSADGRMLASAGADNVVKLWDVTSGEQRRTVTGYSKEVTSVTFFGDSSLFLTGAGDSSIRLKRVTDGGDARAFGGAADFVFSTATTPDGRIVVAGGQDSVLRVWNGETAQQLRSFPAPTIAPSATPAKK